MIIEQESNSESDLQKGENISLKPYLDEDEIRKLYQSFERLKKFINLTSTLNISQNDQLSKYLLKFGKPNNPIKNNKFKDVVQLAKDRIQKFRTLIFRMIKSQKIRKNWSWEDRIILDQVAMRLALSKNCKNVEKEFIKQDWENVASFIPGSNSTDCMFKWLSLHKTNLNESNWSKQQSDLLKSLVEKQVNANKTILWKDVCKKLYLQNQNAIKKYRTHKQCKEHWICKLNPNIKRQPWTQEEDILLFKTIKQNFGLKKWKEMVILFKGRTQNAVKNRYNLIIEKEKKSFLKSCDELHLIDRFIQRCYAQKFTKIIQPDSEQEAQQIKAEKSQKIKPKKVKKSQNQHIQFLTSLVYTEKYGCLQKISENIIGSNKTQLTKIEKNSQFEKKQMSQNVLHKQNNEKAVSMTNLQQIFTFDHRENDVYFDFTYN